jgi:hypothetical protein
MNFEAVFVDMRCANCGHSPESHYAGYGQCYTCKSEQRCPAWRPKTQEALLVNQNKNPWKTMYEEGVHDAS